MLGYKKGMCSASLLAFHKQATPLAELTWRQIKTWIQLWVEHPELHMQIRKTWRKIPVTTHPEQHAEIFNRARGPVGSMVAVLDELEMNPMQPDRWDTGKGRPWGHNWGADRRRDLQG